MGNVEERSYIDILDELRLSIQSDKIPYQQRVVIEDQIAVLFELLWKWSA